LGRPLFPFIQHHQHIKAINIAAHFYMACPQDIFLVPVSEGVTANSQHLFNYQRINTFKNDLFEGENFKIFTELYQLFNGGAHYQFSEDFLFPGHVQRFNGCLN